MDACGFSRGRVIFALLAVFASIVCVRLGFWQLSRHAEARDELREREVRLSLPRLPASRLAAELDDPIPRGVEPWRRVELAGEWVQGGDVLIRSRSRNGRPGVHVVTPLRLDAELEAGPVVLVLRGWVPADDALTPERLAAPTPATIDGRDGVVRPSRSGAGGPVLEVEVPPRPVPRLSFAAVDVEAIARRLAAEGIADVPAAPFFVQLLPGDETGEAASDPTERGAANVSDREPDRAAETDRTAVVALRGGAEVLSLPDPDPGPHLGYAIQWFSFALIFLVGAIAYLWRGSRRPGPTSPPKIQQQGAGPT